MVLVQTPSENLTVLFRKNHLPNLKFGVFYLLITGKNWRTETIVRPFGFGYPQHKIPVP